MLKKTEQS